MKKAKELYDRARVSLVFLFSLVSIFRRQNRPRASSLGMPSAWARALLEAVELWRKASEREEL